MIRSMMCRAITVGILAAVSSGAIGTSSGYPLEDITPDLRDKPSLQRGAALYMNYCLGCHSLKYQRYERTADDLGIPRQLMAENLIFTGAKIGEQIRIGMDEESAKTWFGAPPPDLTLEARLRDPDWIYTYLKTFYVDETRPFGVNNEVFPNVGMPHVLLELQGVQRKGCDQVPMLAENGGERRDPLVQGTVLTEEKCGVLVVDEGTGKLGEDEYSEAIYDLVNFLWYVGEPSRLQRYEIGVYVLLFLVVLGAVAYLLNREYWKDVK